MSVFYKSHSVGSDAGGDHAIDLTLPRPVDTLVLINGIMYRSTNATVATYDSGWTIADDDYQLFGTNGDFRAGYDSANNQFEVEGLNVIAGGATDASADLYLDTGDRTINDAVAGSPRSGSITIVTGTTNITTAAGASGATGDLTLGTGASDTNFAGSTGGGTGAVAISTGAASSTTGNASGNTGAISLATGASVDGSSGSISLTPGTSSTTANRGHVQVTGLRHLSAQATAITGARTMSLADSGGYFSVAQSSAYAIDLPDVAAGNAGVRYTFVLISPGAFNVTIEQETPAATFIGTIVNGTPACVTAAGQTLTFATGAAVAGDTIEVFSTGVNWVVRAFTSAAAGITVA